MRLMSEHGVGWPLWDDAGPMEDGTPEVPAPLGDRLREWAALFEDGFDRETGWTSQAAARRHRELGKRLVFELRAALPGADLTYVPWPHAASDSDASAVRRLRLMNEYGASWPLWDEEGVLEDGWPQVPQALAAELRAWAAQFNEEFDHEDGWTSEEIARKHQAWGERLFVEVSAALPHLNVQYEPWEHEGPNAV